MVPAQKTPVKGDVSGRVGLSWKRKRQIFMFVFTVPTLLFFCLFMIYPIFHGLYFSFTDWSGGSETKNLIGIDNYRELAKDPIIGKAILNDYFFVFWKVVGIVGLGVLFAVLMTRFRIRGSGFFRSVFFIPNILSVVVIGVLWNYIYNPSIGFLNSFLSLFTADKVQTPWLGDPNLAMWMLLPPAIWAGVGFVMILVIAGILNIPKDLYEAASIDGAQEWQQFWRITMPLTWEQIKVSILWVVMTTLNGSFVIVWMMTEGGPDNATQVMGSYLYQMGFRQFHFGYASAIGVLILILSLITTLALQRLLRRDAIEMA
ncbi:sugar ABC transporter permease [Paenibacillus sp. chi10]|uniref:Sugar ABC transporter permease n=1 Tax=Paenibacillus suaedae TaxID=3077233 RepID=A0AAJ2N4R2_9BACL|nr:sugar ABC transporter permease [Paenibacillus sp. chi10]MDT8976890.1 sugar ABC transporter permease [Paenibacillus sp. chi10]